MPTNRRSQFQKVAAIAVLALASGPSLLPATIFKVGSDGACTHATIPNALVASLAAGADEIRIARNQTYNNLYIHLTDRSSGTVGQVTLVGVYVDARLLLLLLLAECFALTVLHTVHLPK